MELEKKIEAVLFWKGEPISRKKLGEILEVSSQEIEEALVVLKNNLQGRGIVLVEKDNDLMLATGGELASLIENLQKEELKKDLSKSALEVLSIVLYKNGVSRAEIDYIRGVNSSFTLRMLSIRGLVEKVLDPKDNRRYIYKPSFELLSYMGVKNVQELPEYNEIVNSIDKARENLEEDLRNEENS
ncbi:MAG: SMC-Scp complex subunit ScpB [Candidatus Pacebacteria bacterium]|nr:SMC-Scp complex subunit ScpB [Candidatus Paceibacterota bacterium]MBP9839731.1 SMC-Scp complex subunit ScpB [Candidatus Paceibacterota bacterium]MDQ5922481.1 segregation and condensation protein [Patescibacteria group bacterium]